MADRSAIEWTDATWNPVRGCTRVSAGCQHCYAERVAARFCGAGQPYEGLIHPTTKGWNGKVKLVPEVMDQPLRWRKPRRIFVNSMSDLFHEGVPDEFIDKVFAVMATAQQHTFQVLTKRPARALAYLTANRSTEHRYDTAHHRIRDEQFRRGVGPSPGVSFDTDVGQDGHWPLRNVWLGVSVEDQATADERIPLLLQCPAAVRWISAEPLLGRVDLCEHLDMWWNSTMQCFEGTGQRINVHHDGRQRIGWVVAGGESGPGARPMHPDWARSLRDQCAAADVPFLFKQWGEYTLQEVDAGASHRSHVCCIDRAGRDWALSKPKGEVWWATGPDDSLWRRIEKLPIGLVEWRRTGKKAAGRLLDGVLHDAYPEPRR